MKASIKSQSIHPQPLVRGKADEESNIRGKSGGGEGEGRTGQDDTRRIARFCINFRAIHPRKSRVYLARVSFSPMSDSHVNDIRYTALWRPVVKAREAPAASPPPPSPSVLHLDRFSPSVACGFAVCSWAFPFSLPLGKSRVSARARATWISQTGSGCGRGYDRKFYLLWWKARRERMLSLRGTGKEESSAATASPASTATVRIAEWDPLPFMRGQPSWWRTVGRNAYPSFISWIGCLNLYFL